MVHSDVDIPTPAWFHAPPGVVAPEATGAR
jgi:hypothetical protein